ncbi:MAG: TfoX/Sxy family protein [Saprospiraceae bacterium]|nr:TfoX/Sxy family protein [Saprospiraceae bacterium]
MAYSEKQAENIRKFFLEKGTDFSEKKMFSGICFMVDDKMCCGTHTDKTSGEEFLLCRIGDEVYEEALMMEHCIPMNFTGKAMKGYVFITESGLDTSKKLAFWLQKCLDFNPKAKKTKK